MSQAKTPGEQNLDSRYTAQSTHSQAHPRPLGVTLLAFGVLTLAGLNLFRLVDGIRLWGFYADLLIISPLYLVLTGLVWATVGIRLAWGLWRGRSWAPRLARWSVVAYFLYYWVDRLLFWEPTMRTAANWPFALFFSFAVPVIMIWFLSRLRVKAFFGELHDN